MLTTILICSVIIAFGLLTLSFINEGEKLDAFLKKQIKLLGEINK